MCGLISIVISKLLSTHGGILQQEVIIVFNSDVRFLDVDDDFDLDAGFAKTPTDDRWEGEDEDLKEVLALCDRINIFVLRN